MIVALAPFDAEFAAGQRHVNGAPGPLQPRRRDGGGAGGRAACPGQARAALPGPHHDVIAIDDVRQRDVGALGKDRVVFQQRPEAFEIVGVDIVDPEDRVRVAHAGDRGRMQDRIVDRADLQFDVAGVAEFLGERNVLPAEFRRTHVHREQVRRRPLPAVDEPGAGLEGQRRLARGGEGLPRHAAHAVAAGVRLRAVVVIDADEGFGAGHARRLQHHELVVGHALRRGHRLRFGRRDRAGRIAQVDDDDLVADAVHFREAVIVQNAHGPPVRASCRRLICRRVIWRSRADWPVRRICVDGRAPPFMGRTSFRAY